MIETIVWGGKHHTKLLQFQIMSRTDFPLSISNFY